jgi:tetratricopeptide (TPR) repeat protein
MLLVLLLLALGAVFILPRYVSEPWIAGDSGQDSAGAAPSPTAVSPSTAAEKTRYRQDSQSVLAQIIAARDELEDQNIEMWAEIDFRRALSGIETGDQQYSFGEYEASLETYERVLSELTALGQLGREKLAGALADGFNAIESLNIPVANASTELANAIAPDEQEVQELMARSENLPELAGLIELGDQAREADQLESAKAAYQEAVGLDPQHRRAAESLSAIRTAITENEFRRHMSNGYAALERDDFKPARNAFRQAGKVYPGHAAVTQALAQVDNRQSQMSVSEQLNRAAGMESREEWAQALSVYEVLLQQDPSLTEARVRRIPAQVRSDLDRRMAEVFEDPLNLQNPSFYRSARNTLEDARGIPNPGERLREQIVTLENYLASAVSTVDVIFHSDNLTEVTLFRVAELGRFEQTSMKLKPGRYVIGGTRQGFRDVRVEFTLTGEPLNSPIVVRCDEPI